MATIEQVYARRDAEQRFFTASSGRPPSAQQKDAVDRLREKIIDLAVVIDVYVPGGYNKLLALNALEDVQMRANRGIFAEAKAAMEPPYTEGHGLLE